MPIWTPPAGSAGAASGKEAGPGASGANKPPLKAIAESEADSGGEDGPKDDEATGLAAINSIFFCFPFGKKSSICMEGRSMAPCQGNTLPFVPPNSFVSV